ncbi:TPA: hypothetical protein P2Q98_000221 [Aeromonas veronii]|uniref:hypothetical protein n=1 Tax=Aeromonas veronii TaxID=654 RepID=UPI0033083A1C|nr:hypothetical protein [Aeromonas veronii]HDO1332133.1 hypothetical protein [Aeromonas veronii]HDO1339049.1 hypothetical protein [Aeromonas veronii]HDO1341192.1 hypothetical protein [Aeromonas veronii]HDO1345766.1 hypothetical protein [Aeromonas veronii]
MAISKEQWQAIAAELKNLWVQLNFKLHGHEITIRRCRKSESTTVLGVYIDGEIKGAWMKQLDEIDPADEFMNKVAKQVFFHKFKAMYSKKELETMAKHKRRLGAKRIKEMFGEAPEKAGWTYLVPYFASSTALVRQFKKIEGLELVSELKEVAA